ncbi:glycosyl transferase [Fulvivirga maritima]|uniref:glycosyltransferase n=1 Tax=Fulvivirga maritima TaxID=2904247 RepID=UPI001F29A270|nr:nucleotide disphospho-sugar-binding domain-containing protein [Fulvivirga maritima]UII24739.1 glycosyl transferase [Fulvivirga maritima]
MARFVFIVPPFTGHINPTLSLGKQLLQAGHKVAWISLTDNFNGQIPDGGELLLIQSGDDGTSGKEYFDQITEKGHTAFGIESIKFLYEDVLIPMSRFMFPGICKFIDSWRADVVITDHQVYAGAIAAVKKRIPYVTSVTAPTALKAMKDMPKILEWETEQIVGLQQELGIAGNSSLACSELLTLVFTSKEFLGDETYPEYYQFVGPITVGRPVAFSFNWARFQNTRGPRVLVSIGTTFDMQYKKDFFAKVIEALGDEPMTVVVVSEEKLFPSWPKNFIVQPRIPQLELLKYLDAVVCHGGHNTVCESLTHGLPLITIPIAYDQSHVSSQVAESGCGIRLNFKRFKATQLKTAVQDILNNPSYKEASKFISNSFTAAGGEKRAVELLEDVVPQHTSVYG